ncbi:MAG: hypothetical protein HQK51_14375 [Oligoflexia bacterium]|nr:hypothetical protein [Oligoflexia bacterium]
MMTLLSIYKYQNKNKSKSKSGFSYVSLIMLVASIGISATAIIAVMGPNILKKKIDETNKKMDRIEQAIILYKTHRLGIPPATLENLLTTDGVVCAVDTNMSSPTYRKLLGWCGPYVNIVFVGMETEYKLDGWGIAYEYGVDAQNGVSLKSCGPNLICGDSDDIVRKF